MKRSIVSSTESYKLWLLARYRHYKHHRKRRLAEPEKLPHSVRFGYSMGHVLNDLCASMWFTYLLVFYTAVIGLSHTVTGVIMIIGQIADATATPVVGYLSDRGSTHKKMDSKRKWFGKRKGWYVLGSIMVLCTKPFMFSPCFACPDCVDELKMLYYSAFIIIFQFGWAAVQTVHLAMAADLTPHDSERTFLLALRNTLTAVCNSLTYIGQWISMSLQEDEHKGLCKDDIISFQLVVASILLLGTVTSILFLVIVPEDASKFRTVSSEESQGEPSVHAPIRVTLSKWRVHYIGFIYLCTRVFVVSVQALLTMYLHESLHAYSYELASIPLVLNIMCFMASLITSPMNGIFGRKLTYSTGTLFGIGAVVWTFFGKDETYRHGLVYVVASFYGAASALLQVTALALIAEYIGEDINNGAFIYGYMSFLDKVSTGVTLALIMHFKPDKAKDYFTYAVIATCAISSILGTAAICCYSVPGIVSEQSMEDMKKSREEQNKSKDKPKDEPRSSQNVIAPATDK